MKFYVSFIVCFTMIQTLFAQGNYTPMNIGSGHYWINHYKVIESGFTLAEGDLLSYFDKDTTINAVSYHRLKSKVLQEDIPNPTLYTFFNKMYTYLREDTMQRRVNRLFSSSNLEIFLLNFNLSLNDFDNICQIPFIVDSIYTTLYAGIPRKTYKITYGSSNVGLFIEGIGSNINFPICIEGDWKYYLFNLKCAGKGNQIWYTSNPNDTCNTTLPLFENNVTKESELFDFDGYQIRFFEPQKISFVKIITIDGKVVFNTTKPNKQNLQIANSMAPGLYLVQVRTTTGHQTKKIIVLN